MKDVHMINNKKIEIVVCVKSEISHQLGRVRELRTRYPATNAAVLLAGCFKAASCGCAYQISGTAELAQGFRG